MISVEKVNALRMLKWVDTFAILHIVLAKCQVFATK